MNLNLKGNKMWVSRDKIINNKNLVGHIVMVGLCQIPEVLDATADAEGCVAVLTLNGKEVNLQEVVDNWEAQMDKMIKKEAHSLVEEKMEELQHLINGITIKLREGDFLPAEDWY
jgi:hypothetical protein